MLRFFIVTIVAAASASVIHDGVCPEMKPVENFNVSAYAGTWYEISKYPAEAEKNGKCGSAEYKVEGDVIKVKNTHVVNGVQAFIEGTAKLAADANKAAKLQVSFKFGDVVSESPLLVLATDYNNYAVAYNCKYDEKTKKHETNAWVLSRSKKLEGNAKTEVDNFLKANSKELDASKFLQTDFSEEACKFNGTSLITEAPKPNKS
ncbi:insecticyanin-B-like [Pectinophora gossypiella]|uniref:insecticyanin-B-like n=1 Tax=Pectinophora gossypiella TaxID=13191 RepID=UPI00214EA3ED|nr:insecticyanin-B-like [Pectinophora gossypiella]